MRINTITFRLLLTTATACGMVAAMPVNAAPAVLSAPAADDHGTVRGVVVDEQGEPIVGATVKVKGTTNGVVTNADGEFVIGMLDVKGTVVLSVSFIGMKPSDTPAVIGKTIKIVLKDDAQTMGDVVVTGMYARKKEGFTGSANTMSGDDIRKMTSGNVLKAIQLLDPGFRMGDNSISGSNPNSMPDFNMRGQSSMATIYRRDSVYARRYRHPS